MTHIIAYFDTLKGEWHVEEYDGQKAVGDRYDALMTPDNEHIDEVFVAEVRHHWSETEGAENERCDREDLEDEERFER